MTDKYELTMKLRPYGVGSVKAKGWMHEQMKQDLHEGFLGDYKAVCPLIDQDMFGKTKLKSNETLDVFPENFRPWWSAEEEAYLKEGVMRMAILTDDHALLTKAKGWMDRILKFQEEDGYIGMYTKGDDEFSRYNHQAENAELWVQSRIFAAMLAWYEYTQDEVYLNAVIKAVGLSMNQYADRSYFKMAVDEAGTKRGGGGHSHSVGFCDTLLWLYRLTGESDYLTFFKTFYTWYNEDPPRDDDLTLKNLTDDDRPFTTHTPHVVEGLYMPQLMASLTSDKAIEKAARAALRKARIHFTPGGGIVGSENVDGRPGTADTPREYCAVAEVLYALNQILSITGDPAIAEMTEQTALNAGQGARLPVLTAMQYLSEDNRIEISQKSHGGRCAYDAWHIAAVCCTTSAARLLPYYIDGMWFFNTESKGVTVMNYGPSLLRTEIAGKTITIEQETSYPFSDVVKFKIDAEAPTYFELSLRVPCGLTEIDVSSCPDHIARKTGDGFLRLSGNWIGKSDVTVKFPFTVKVVPHPESISVPGGGAYLKRGPLLFGLSFPYNSKRVKEHGASGFYRLDITASDKTGWDYILPAVPKFEMVSLKNGDELRPWANPPIALRGDLLTQDGKSVRVSLVPEGCAVLRRVAFPQK